MNLIKNILILSMLFVCSIVFGQTNDVFRMVGNGSWTTVDDSTYTATVVFQADLTGKGYLANQITTNHRLFSPIGAVYRISNVSGATFSQATLTIVELIEATAAPTGQVMVYAPDGRETVPQNPFGSTGATAQLQAAIDTWNASLGAGGGGASLVAGDGIVIEGDTVNIGGSFDENRTVDLAGDTVTWSGNSGLFLLDNGTRLKFENAELERVNNATGAVYITVTVNADVNLVGDKDGLLKIVHNISGDIIFIDPTAATTVDGKSSIQLQDGESVLLAYNADTDDYVAIGGNTTGIGSQLHSMDSITVAGSTAWIYRQGGTTSTFTNSAAGVYDVEMLNRAHLEGITIFGNNATLNGSNEMIITITSNPNRTKRYMLELYDANNDALVDQFLTGTNHTQAVGAATTTFTIPGLNGFGATGYYVVIR